MIEFSKEIIVNYMYNSNDKMFGKLNNSRRAVRSARVGPNNDSVLAWLPDWTAIATCRYSPGARLYEWGNVVPGEGGRQARKRDCLDIDRQNSAWSSNDKYLSSFAESAAEAPAPDRTEVACKWLGAHVCMTVASQAIDKPRS